MAKPLPHQHFTINSTSAVPKYTERAKDDRFNEFEVELRRQFNTKREQAEKFLERCALEKELRGDYV